MRILPSKAVAEQFGMDQPGITVLQADILWARRDRFYYNVEALIDITITYSTPSGPVVTRRQTLANTSISREPGLRMRLVRSAALLTAMIGRPDPQKGAIPLAA